MDRKNIINSAVPTPFGSVLLAQDSFDLDSILAFTKQLSSLSRGLGVSVPVVSEATVLVPVRA